VGTASNCVEVEGRNSPGECANESQSQGLAFSSPGRVFSVAPCYRLCLCGRVMYTTSRIVWLRYLVSHQSDIVRQGRGALAQQRSVGGIVTTAL
jgi:hypothetical protein